MDSTFLIEYMSVNPDYLTVFSKNPIPGKRKKTILPPLFESKQPNKPKGNLSRNSIVKMRRAIGYLSTIAREKKVQHHNKGYSFFFKLSFITLTLSSSQKHNDFFIKNVMLKNFIDVLKKRYPAISYVWKAEPQKNGNIHFHIMTDHFVPVFYVQFLWNKIQRKHGYLDEYMKKNLHAKAPSTEIRKVRNDKEVSKYMRKYMTKGDPKKSYEELMEERFNIEDKISECQNTGERYQLLKKLRIVLNDISYYNCRKIDGKLWGCSDNLLKKPFVDVIEGLSEINRNILLSLNRVFQNEYISVYSITNFKRFLLKFVGMLGDEIREYYNFILNPKAPFIKLYNTNSNYSYEIE